MEGQVQLKEQILLAVQNEQSPSIRRRICEVVAEVARNLLDDEGNNLWPEFLNFLFQCANGPNVALKESALRMFTCVPGVFGNQQPNYLDLIKQMLQLSVNDSNYEVRSFIISKFIVSFWSKIHKCVISSPRFVTSSP